MPINGMLKTVDTGTQTDSLLSKVLALNGWSGFNSGTPYFGIPLVLPEYYSSAEQRIRPVYLQVQPPNKKSLKN